MSVQIKINIEILLGVSFLKPTFGIDRAMTSTTKPIINNNISLRRKKKPFRMISRVNSDKLVIGSQLRYMLSVQMKKRRTNPVT